MRQTTEAKLNEFLDSAIPLLKRIQIQMDRGEPATTLPVTSPFKSRKALLRHWIRKGKPFTIQELKDEMTRHFPERGPATRNSIMAWTYQVAKEESKSAIFLIKEMRFTFKDRSSGTIRPSKSKVAST